MRSVRALLVLLFLWAARGAFVPAAQGQATSQGQAASPAPRDTASDAVAARVLRTDPTVHRDTLDLFRRQPFQLRPFILPGSERVAVGGVQLDSSQYRLDAREGRLWLNVEPPGGDAWLTVAYRTFPFRFQDVYRRRGVADTTAGGSVAIREEGGDEGEAGKGFDPFEGVTLERSGSISRGVIAGSNRDATVESGLRMQLAGRVSDQVKVRAVLTDENTPLQPEGTTQRLDDFDRVFMELAAPQGTARLGDVDLELKGTTFARFRRKIQGASVVAQSPAPEARWMGKGNVKLAGATARGTYRLQQIEPIDGVQGPYQLRSADGEEYVIVVAGSETVYLDGERLERGASADYTIDYARAQITFTPEHLITDDRRIRVEFEYRTSGYARTLVAGQGTAGFWRRAPGGQRGGEPRLTVGASFIREADSRSLGGAFDLSAQDSLRLTRAGDEVAVGSGAMRVPFEAEAPYVPYRRVLNPDASGEAGDARDSVFVALEVAPPEGTPVWQVRFSRVGAGQGSYARTRRRANGAVYEYRGPGRGDYAPVRRLPRPKQQRLFDVHGRLEPVDGVEVFGEWARSMNDQNRFSTLDAGDDRGQAYHTGLRLKPLALQVGGLSLGRLSGEAERRFRGQHFASFVRTRPVEFGRKWNLPAERIGATGGVRGAGDETVDEAALRLRFLGGSEAAAEWGRLTLGEGAFRGVRRAGRLRLEEAGWPRLEYRAEFITSRDRLGATLRDEPVPSGEALFSHTAGDVNGRWFRQRGTLWKPLLGGQLVPRFDIEHERRRQRLAGTDSLTRRSLSFVEVRPNVTFRTGALRAGAEVEFRSEEEAAAGALRAASTAWTVQTNAAYRPSDDLDVQGRVGYRHRRASDFFRQREGRQGTSALIAQVEGRYRPFGQAVEVRGLYRAQTERTPILQERYVRAGPERGQYVWGDENDDGLVQTDELLPEQTPNEGTYVRRYVPSDSLQPVVGVEARLRVDLSPARRWHRSEARWKRILARAQTQTTLEVREESRTSDLADVYLLNLRSFRQPGRTQQGRLRLSQRVRLFPRAARVGLEFSVNQVRSLSDLAAGTEQNFRSSWEAEGRYRPGRRWGLRLRGLVGQNRTRSEAFASRRYDIDRYQIEPEASLRVAEGVRLTVGGVFAQKADAVGARRAQVLRAPVKVEWSRTRRFRLTAHAEGARVNLTGEATGRARYELTDGRGAGTSYRWGLGGRYAINRFLSASLSYDARAPSATPVVHTARLNLSASF